MDKAKILVTGGQGFIGSNFVDAALSNGFDVTNFSKATYSFNPRVLKHHDSNSLYRFVAGDITDGSQIDEVIRKNSFDYVVHFAASTHVDRSFTYPKEFLESNVVGTFNILRSLEQTSVQKYIHISTDEVFGYVPEGERRKPNDILDPLNPYAATKACGEILARAWSRTFRVPLVMLRFTNNYGPRQHPEKLIAKLITRCLSGKKFTLFEGGSRREWVYVKDTVDLLLRAIDLGVVGKTYHVGSYVNLSVQEIKDVIMNEVSKYLGRDVHDLFEGEHGSRIQDDERYSLDFTSSVKELGWNSFTPFEVGIKQTIQWFDQNRWYWEWVYAP